MSKVPYRPSDNPGGVRSLPFLGDYFNGMDVWVSRIESVRLHSKMFYVFHVVEPREGQYQVAGTIAEAWKIQEMQRQCNTGSLLGFHFSIGKHGRFSFEEPRET